MALFQHEDFIILGMLFAKYFSADVYYTNQSKPSNGTWVGGGGGWLPQGIVEYGTGRGGLIADESAGRGDDGRPGISDNATGPTMPSLAGQGGDIAYPGRGLNNGDFGLGGNATMTPGAFTRSAGGGGGWFGGGSSYIDAGGGGGSNFVYSATLPAVTAMLQLGKQYSENIPKWIKPGKWVGIDPDTEQHYIENRLLYTYNTMYYQEYEIYKGELGLYYDDFIRLHTLAKSNGLILISEPDTLIEYYEEPEEPDEQEGEKPEKPEEPEEPKQIRNIATIIEYTGKQVKWIPPRDGKYHFILWGAQGGTTFYTPKGMSELKFQQYTGGFGGAVGVILDLKKLKKDAMDEDDKEEEDKEEEDKEEETDPDKPEDEEEKYTKLYFCVGELGKVGTANTRAWNGGGNSSGGCTGGGGATDIRYDGLDGSTDYSSGFMQRIAVAGGGGGVIGNGSGNEPPQGPFLPPGGNDSSPPTGDDDEVIGGGGDDTEIQIKPNQWFPVNDLSIVLVEIQYFTQAILPPNPELECIIYLYSRNGKLEGTLTQTAEIDPVSGVIYFNYYLDAVYPPYTDTHLVKIVVEIPTKKDFMFVIPGNGIKIDVYTRPRPNEPDPDVNQAEPIFLQLTERLKLKDICRLNIQEIAVDRKISIIEDMEDLNDISRVTIRNVRILKLSVLEKLGLLDLSSARGIYPPDIELRIIEKLESYGIHGVRFVDYSGGDIGAGSEEEITISDMSRVLMRTAKINRISMVEDMSLIDYNNIKEE